MNARSSSKRMDGTTAADRSNGYEAAAREFMSRRTSSVIGSEEVQRWARVLPRGASVLDLGCGHGVPITQALIDEGCHVYGVDASPSLIEAFRARFPAAPAECCAVEESAFFGRSFDGVVAWGLMFLLAPETQRTLIRKVADTLRPGGRFLFTSPRQACEWPDNLTKRRSVSLGAAVYRQILEAAGLTLVDEFADGGDNHYFSSRRPERAAVPTGSEGR